MEVGQELSVKELVFLEIQPRCTPLNEVAERWRLVRLWSFGIGAKPQGALMVDRDQTRSVMDFLLENRAPGLPLSAIAEVFDSLIWCLRDNGAALLDVREGWLLGDRLERVEVALAMNETYPFTNPDEMSAVLKEVGLRWPHLEARCSELMEARTLEQANRAR